MIRNLANLINRFFHSIWIARLLSHELKNLDYSLRYKACSAKVRNPAVDAKTMFKLLTYASILPEGLKQPKDGISTGCWQAQKRQTPVRLPSLVPVFFADAWENLFYQIVKYPVKGGFDYFD